MPPVEVATDDFLHFANDYVDSLNATYTKAIPNDIKQRAWQSTLQGYRQLEDMGINRPFNSKAHAKTMLFSRLSSMAGVTGSMAPFFCEFTLNADICRHEYPAWQESGRTDSNQPPMETFVKIAELLEVDINELLRTDKKWLSQNSKAKRHCMSLQKTKSIIIRIQKKKIIWTNV